MRKGLLVVVLMFFALMFVGQAMAQESTSGGAEWSKTAFDAQLAKAKVMKLSGTVLSHGPCVTA